MWTVIVVTCATASQGSAIQKELQILQRKGRIATETVILTVEDPGIHVGSGSATFNALLVTAEHLSAKNDFQIITSDVLHTSRILIIHHGRGFPYDPSGKAFLTLPLAAADEKNEINQNLQPAGLVSNFEKLLDTVTTLSSNTEYGVWVCSTDMLLQGTLTNSIPFPSDCDSILFSTLEDIDYATNHGVIHINKSDNSVQNIIYAGPKDAIQQFCIEKTKVPVVAGIVFLSTTVAESLLSLHVVSPMDSCTYMGQDSGATPLQVSLYFDILIAMGSGVTQEAYVSGDYCESYNAKHDYNHSLLHSTQHVRRLFWKELSKYKMKAYIMADMQYKYLSECNNASTHCSILKNCSRSSLIHTYIKETTFSDTDSKIVVNSHLQFVNFGSNVVVQHCHLRGTRAHPISIENSTYLLGVYVDTEKVPFRLNEKMVLIETTIQLEVSGSVRPKRITILFGIDDSLALPVTCKDATVCNISWNELFQKIAVTHHDLWPHVDEEENRNLMSARLFPVNLDNIQNLLWLQSLDNNVSSNIIEKWRRSTRFSISDIMAHTALAHELTVRRQLYCHVTTKLVQKTLLQNQVQSLLPYFKCAVVEGWHTHLLSTMDEVAFTFDHDKWEPGKAARTLACIADLLGCMAGKEGGLRSGPAANNSWNRAFAILEKGSRGSIAQGVQALSLECENWLDTPIKLTRAARHYEGAAQILIRHAVMTAKESVHLGATVLPRIGDWVSAECPARVDLQGGWTDTPPICYELGGSVVNVALLIDGKRPIGAKGRRIEDLQLELVIGKDDETAKRITIHELQQLTDYRQLTAVGALLKAAIVCAEVVDVHHAHQTLKEQLSERYQSGLVIQCWSTLPEGSGLGTSSILAGAIIAVLWTVTGKIWDRLSLIHSVLCLEQMLTTGGGWQDQVSGIMGGVNFTSSPAGLPIRVEVEPIPLSPEFEQKMNNHLLLVYTGKVRLAKNLLQNVIRNWYARDVKIVDCFKQLVDNAHACKAAFKQENMATIGKLLTKYWQQKISIAPGCDPAAIREMMAAIQPFVHGQTLAGAGGGGFIFILTKQPNMHREIRDVIEKTSGRSVVSIYPATIDRSGININQLA